MGDLLDAAMHEPRSRGGQPHNFPKVLESLPVELHDDIRALLGSEATDWAGFVRVLAKRYPGCHRVTQSTWRRWSIEYRADPDWEERVCG